MYGSPTDPTFSTAYVRELRRQGRTCASCRHNIQKPGEKYCARSHGAWPTGPCARYDDDEDTGT